MNKAPAFQFYVSDYMRDTRCLSLAAKGAWTDCLCAMWFASTRGEITYPVIGYARLFGCTVEQAKAVIDELAEMQICGCVTHDDGKMTLINRRMQRESKERLAANNRQKRYVENKKRGNDKADDGNNDGSMTTLLQSSSSSAINSSRSSGNSARGKPSPETAAPAAVFDESLKETEAKETRLDQLQAKYARIDVRRVRKKYLDYCARQAVQANWKIFEVWLKNEGEPMAPETHSPPEDAALKRRTLIDACPLCDANGYIKIGDGARACRHAAEKTEVKN